ncbi:MAG: hypothetical protein IT210_00535 [Armatimonadetes bacterium]|nr:hypothetical protein [Armatimonadota bacterium]
MRYLLILFALLLAGAALADDIVTMPTANQLKAREVDVALYYLDLDNQSPAPRFVQYQTAYIGLTDKVELDIHRAAVDNNETSIVLVGSVRLLSETKVLPDLVAGVRNLGGEATIINPPGAPVDLRAKSRKRSFFVSAAKTFFMNPAAPGPPLVRAHLSLGTEDWTLLGEKRHEGLFGGLQFLFHPEFGGILLNDGQDTITGITYMPKNTGLTIKGGTYGDHTWFGVAYRRAF